MVFCSNLRNDVRTFAQIHRVFYVILNLQKLLFVGNFTTWNDWLAKRTIMLQLLQIYWLNCCFLDLFWINFIGVIKFLWINQFPFCLHFSFEGHSVLSVHSHRVYLFALQGIFMFVTNMAYFGHIKSTDNYKTERKHSDMYELFNNRLVSSLFTSQLWYLVSKCFVLWVNKVNCCKTFHSQKGLLIKNGLFDHLINWLINGMINLVSWLLYVTCFTKIMF